MMTMTASGLRIPRFVLILAVLTLLLADSCSSIPPITSRDQAAGFLLSSTAIPWQQVASTLRPNFATSGDTAAAQVAPVTQEAQFAVLNALGIGVSAGALVGPFKLPASGASAVTTPASVPAAALPTGIPAGATLPGAPAVDTSLPIDPML